MKQGARVVAFWLGFTMIPLSLVALFVDYWAFLAAQAVLLMCAVILAFGRRT